MKQIFTLTLTCLVTLLQQQSANAQCNYSTGSNGTSVFAVNPIVINGNMNDWAPYLNDPDNNSYDNTNGVDMDAPIADAGRDLVRMTFTEDLNYLYLFIERAGSVNNSVDIIFYADINNNNTMDLNEPVIHLNWGGATGNVGVSLNNYIPAVDLISNSISQNLDGKALWGTLSYRNNLGQIGKGSADGKYLEARIPFNRLTQTNLLGNTINQLQPGQSFKFHISTINGNTSSIPNQNSINDNFGGCLNAPAVNGSLPVSLISFQANLKEQTASLNWITSNHFNFSHYVVERSTDGRNFEQAAMVFADASNSNATNGYSYQDNLKNSTAKTIYYRLKMVDIDQKYSYSEVRMVRLVTENKIQVSTFPNPVVNELRVMVPAEWQEKTLTYEIYNSNGVMMSRVQNAKAAQVQQLNVQSLNSGNYIVRVSNGSTVSTSKFVKLN